MTRNKIELDHLSVYYGKRCALFDVSVTFESSCLTGILGPNGSGKSTMIQAMLGLIRPTSGKVHLNSNTIAYVPQKKQIDLDFPISIFDLVMMGAFKRLNWFKWYNKTEKTRALSIMEKLGIYDIKDHQIQQVSGGQFQRAIVARALLEDADFYFLDEPFTGVDFATEHLLIDLFRELRSKGKGVVLVHHDLKNVEDLFDHVVMLNSRLIDFGPTKICYSKENIEKTYGEKEVFLEDASALFERAKSGKGV